MTERLLSGHNSRESTGVARPATLSTTESGLNDQIGWFVSTLAGDTSDFDHDLMPCEAVQGIVYLTVDYYVQNMGRVMPFDPESIGVPADMIHSTVKPKLSRTLALPGRLWRIYRWSTEFYRDHLPKLNSELHDLYWELRSTEDDPMPLIKTVLANEFRLRTHDVAKAHIINSLTLTSLDSIVRNKVPQLMGLLVGQETTTSLLGQRIWELRQQVEQSDPQVRQMLLDGITDLESYQDMDAAAPFVDGVRKFLDQYGHRGFRHEVDLGTERLADRPEHILLTVAGQLREGLDPQQRAKAAHSVAQKELDRLNPISRAIWRKLLNWGQQLIAWREESKSNLALCQAVYGMAARRLSRIFYPDLPDDTMLFYTMDELIEFTQSDGAKRIDMDTIERRRSEYELHKTQPPLPDLIWFDPVTKHWRPALEEDQGAMPDETRIEGIAASAGEGVVEGIALVTNDPLEAGRRLLELEGAVVLVTRLTDPAWSALFPRLSAVVTELGGVISHAAIVARENGLPAVVGVPGVTSRLVNGQRLRVDGATGVVEILK